MPAPTFEKMKPRYTKWWAEMRIDPDLQPAIDKVAKAIVATRKARYVAVERMTGVPWWWIAAAHHREASGSFDGVLHNGEKILGTGRKTKLVPAGRGPFATWEESAVDALKIKGLDKIKDWTIERAAYELERFNGWGYFFRGVPSAYLWSFSNIYLGGKYIADGVWSATTFDKQMGVMPLLRRLAAIDATVAFNAPTPKLPAKRAPEKPAVQAQDVGKAAGAGAAAGTAAVASGMPWWAAALIFLAVALVVAAIVFKRKG